MGLQGASTTTPGARCQKCVKARVIAGPARYRNA
jgi:hypothetical protein